jgi:hypothetical protein
MIDTTLINQILNQSTDRIVRQRGDDSRIQSKASFQSTRYVVFAAAFPPEKCASWPRVHRLDQTQHYCRDDKVQMDRFSVYFQRARPTC